jgi:two-component sensor histidine kinase
VLKTDVKMKFRFFLFFLLTFQIGFSQEHFIEKTDIKGDEDQSFISTSSLLVDNDGFLWHATHNFLTKDYLTHFIKYPITGKKKENISFREIIKTANGNLNLRSDDGVFIFNPLNGNSKWILKGNHILTLKEDNKGNLWVLSTNKVFKYNADGKINIYPIIGKEFPSKHRIQNIKFINENVVIKSDINLYLLNEKEHNFYLINKATKATILKDNGKLFKKNTSGNYYYNNNVYQYKYIPEIDKQLIDVPGLNITNTVYNNLIIKNKKIDFFTINDIGFVFYRFIKRSNNVRLEKVYSINFPIPDHYYNKVFVDKNGVLWYSNDGATIKIAFKKNITPYPIKYTNVRGIAYDSKRKNIYTVEKNHLLKIDSLGKKSLILEGDKYHFEAVTNEKDSILWLGVTSSEILKFDIQTSKYKSYTLPFKNLQTDKFIINYQKKLLIGGKNCLVYFDKEKEIFTPFESEIDFTKHFLIDFIKHKSKVFIATENNGLFIYDIFSKKTTHYTEKDAIFKLSSNTIFDLHLINDDEILIGTNKGLDILNFKLNTLTNLGLKEGLPDKRAVSILESPKDFWVGTYNGLSRIRKKDYNITNYYVEDGLPDNEFNRKSFYKHNDSLLFFGGMGGIISFNPTTLPSKNKDQVLKLTQVFSYNKAKDTMQMNSFNLKKSKEFKLPYNHNFISLFFASLNNDKIFYRLPNLSSSWLEVNNNGRVNLIGLPAGKHTLEVASNLIQAEANVLTYTITVDNVFYKKTWVQGVFIFLLLFLTYLYYFNQRQKIIKQNSLQLKIRELEDKAFRSQMNPHFMFNIISNIQSVLFLKGEEVVSEYISSFATLLNITLEFNENKNITLADEITYLKSYIFLQNIRGDNINVDARFNLDKKLNIDGIKIPTMLLQPIVENALIHAYEEENTKKNKLDLSFKKDKNKLIVSIRDNGIGIAASLKKSKSKSKSYGNKILNERINIYNEINPDKILFSTETNNRGTKVTLSIPMGN